MSEIISPELAQTGELFVEYGGLVWLKSGDPNSIDFRATQTGIGGFRVHQYPLEGDGYCAGFWLWMVEFDALIPLEYHPEILEMKAGQVVETREEAMRCCIEAKNRFCADIKLLCQALSIGDYAAGFNDGQAEIARKIQAVLP